MRAPADRRRVAGGAPRRRAPSLTACGAEPASQAADAGGALPQGADPVELDPADFTVDITNRWWPMAVGDRWVYEETDAEGTVQRVEVTVLDETHTVALGIEARVVHDLVTERRRHRRGHPGLVRAGRRREHLVPRRGDRGVRGRPGRLDRGVVGGRRRRRPAGHRRPGRSGARHGLPAGVPRRRGGGRGRRPLGHRAGGGADRPVHRRPAHAGHDAAGARGVGAEVLRARTSVR